MTSKTKLDLDPIRLRHSTVEGASDKIARAQSMAYLSHLDRADLLSEVVRLEMEVDRLQLAVNALRPVETECKETDRDGYRYAFFQIAELLDLPAMPISPKEAFEAVMLPKLRGLVAETNGYTVAETWRAATTLAHNICAQESDRINADDGSPEAMDALGEAALRIRGWIEPDAMQLLKLLAEHTGRSPEEPTSQPPDSDAEIFARAVVAGVARWEFFTGSDDKGEVCVGGLRYATRLQVGVPTLGAALRQALEHHTVWKQHPSPVKASPPHEHVWQEMTTGGAQCSTCKIVAHEWYCPDSTDHLCHYDNGNFDQCDFCGLPEERK